MAVTVEAQFPVMHGLNLVDMGLERGSDGREVYVSIFVCSKCLGDAGANAFDARDARVAQQPHHTAELRYASDEAYAKKAAAEHKCPETK